MGKQPPGPNTAAKEIVCPPDRHIPVEFHEIYMLVRTEMSVAERSRFEQIAQLVESLFAQEMMVLKRSLKHNFLRFSMGAKDQPLISRVGGGLPTVAELDAAELKLVADFMQLMIAARFHILTTPEWELAKADKFMFSLPVAVNWEYYDDRMLRAFWESSPERAAVRRSLPECSDRVLVFHRGITVAQASGLYTGEKVDLLVDYLVTQPFMALWRRLRKLPPPPDGPQSLNLTDSKHVARKVVERRTLRLLMPTSWAVIKNFHKKLKLQEPAFKEVVVLYRSGAKPPAKVSKLPAIQRPLEQRQREILAGRNIHIKAFHDIPMADMDVIFAEKKVYLKTLTIIQLVITVVGALVAMVTMLCKGDKVDLNLLWSTLSLVAARCGQVYTSAQAERSKIIQDMVNILYDKTDDAQEGVVSMLLEDMAEQQLKEAILTYGQLHSREAEMTEEMIDNDCERFLRKNFDLSIDFAVEDALERLVSWGLVRMNQPHVAVRPKYESVSVEEGAFRLEAVWHQAFKALSEPPASGQFPLHNLVAGTSREPQAKPPPKPIRLDSEVMAEGPAAGAPGPGMAPAAGEHAAAVATAAKASAGVNGGAALPAVAEGGAAKKGLFSGFGRRKKVTSSS